MSSSHGKLICGEDGSFRDEEGRHVQLKGINIDGGSKFPREPYLPSHIPLDEAFYDGDNVSFVGRPWPLAEVAHHIRRIKSMGYNSIRYIITWEALEHKGPGIYDEEFIKYTVEVLRIIDRVGGIYVYLDPHQDVWSRWSGGDGAPMWTLYAAGLDPRAFVETEAAMVANSFPQDPDAYPKMLWTTNYKRLAAGTMYALFFAGEHFAPKCIINGVNIQYYLQKHFVDAFTHLVKRIKALAPDLFEITILGIETLNEPNSGFLAIPNITEIPHDQPLRLGTCPTILEALRLGMGIATEVEKYKLTPAGPAKVGTEYVNPKGTKAWIDTDAYDKHYGFQRSKDWKLGECLWSQNGVWDIDTRQPLIADFFGVVPDSNEKLDEDVFINNYFVDFYSLFRTSIRKVLPETIIFMQPPPLRAPPKIKDTTLLDRNTVICLHYYDGMSLLFKTWNRFFNVNTLGIIRGRYYTPILSLIIGEGAIRRSFKQQLAEMKKECVENLGPDVPVIFSEIGMPFDMNNKHAYQDGDFSSQTSALDALAFALEGSNLSHSWWCYTAENCHKWGDRFNCEDFSFWSIENDDTGDTDPASSINSTINLHLPSRDTKGFEFGSSRSLPTSSGTGTLEVTSSTSDLSTAYFSSSVDRTLIGSGRFKDSRPFSAEDTGGCHAGIRAIDAVVRPYVVAIAGKFLAAEFDLKKGEYTLKVNCDATSPHPTVIYLPSWHFDHDDVKVETDSGRFDIYPEREILEWIHEGGVGTIKITNLNALGRQERGWCDAIFNCLSCFN